jgi:uncharacterized protein (DUF1778 family)
MPLRGAKHVSSDTRDEKRIVLSERDSARVRALLDNPPKPTPALLAAARRRHRLSETLTRPS